MKKLNSVWFMWFAFAAGVIAVLMMFAPCVDVGKGYICGANSIFFNSGTAPGSRGAWPAFIGYMLILAGTLAAGVIALPVVKISFKAERCILYTAAVAEVVGIVLAALIGVWYGLLNGRVSSIPSYTLYPGTYIMIVFGLAAAVFSIIAVQYDKD